jgi:hypothetical protein
MMIELNEFEFPAKDFLRMCRRQQGIKFFLVWAYASVFMYSLAIAEEDWITSSCFSAVMALFLFLVSYFVSRYYAFSKKNLAMFQKRTWSFDEQKYYVITEDGSEGSGPLSTFISADVWNDYYRLYVGTFACFPILKSAFRSEEDRRRFETEILAPILRKKSWKRYVIFVIISALLLGTGFALRAATSSDEYNEAETNYIEE